MTNEDLLELTYLQLYTKAGTKSPRDVNVLLNKSITALRLGETETSLKDAQTARALLCEHSGEKENDWNGRNHEHHAEVEEVEEEETRRKERRAKAFYREGSALAALGRFDEAVSAFRKGLCAKPRDPGLYKALVNISHHVKIDWLSGYFSDLIADAEKPNRFSSRDGKLLKRPIDRYQLDASELQARTRDVLLGREQEFRTYACQAWGSGMDPRRCILSVIRAYCYLSRAKGEEEEAVAQSVKDADAAVAYMPKGGLGRAHAVRSAVLEHLGDYCGAVLDVAEARKLDAESEEYSGDFERLRGKLSEEQRGVLDEGGAEGLRQWLEDEKEKKLPEFMRKRPKYYYYYEWMKKRIHEHYPELPPPVVDKLLTTDADELDLLLQYPQAIKGQVEEYMEVLKEHGEEYLESYETPRLSWDEVRALNQPTITKQDLTNHSLVAGGGQGQLTDVERRGLPVKPELDPDTARLSLSMSGGAAAAGIASAAITQGAQGTNAEAEEVVEEEDLDGVD